MLQNLSYLRCIVPCVWPVGLLIVGAIWLKMLRSRMLYRGPLPSDGPEDGFASKQARIEFYDTTDARTRSIWKAGWVFGILFVVGTPILYFVSQLIFN